LEDWSRLRPRDGERFIQAVRFRLRVPEVVTLSEYDRLPTAAVTFSRRNIFKRDRFTCQYCGAQPGSEELTLDHVIPRSQDHHFASVPGSIPGEDARPHDAGARRRGNRLQPGRSGFDSHGRL
jgi:5-methylcytosine-specific restriction endonuclease McrA